VKRYRSEEITCNWWYFDIIGREKTKGADPGLMREDTALTRENSSSILKRWRPGAGGKKGFARFAGGDSRNLMGGYTTKPKKKKKEDYISLRERGSS